MLIILGGFVVSTNDHGAENTTAAIAVQVSTIDHGPRCTVFKLVGNAPNAVLSVYGFDTKGQISLAWRRAGIVTGSRFHFQLEKIQYFLFKIQH